MQRRGVQFSPTSAYCLFQGVLLGPWDGLFKDVVFAQMEMPCSNLDDSRVDFSACITATLLDAASGPVLLHFRREKLAKTLFLSMAGNFLPLLFFCNSLQQQGESHK